MVAASSLVKSVVRLCYLPPPPALILPSRPFIIYFMILLVCTVNYFTYRVCTHLIEKRGAKKKLMAGGDGLWWAVSVPVYLRVSFTTTH